MEKDLVRKTEKLKETKPEFSRSPPPTFDMHFKGTGSQRKPKIEKNRVGYAL